MSLVVERFGSLVEGLDEKGGNDEGFSRFKGQ